MDPSELGGVGSPGFPQPFELGRSLLDSHHPDEVLAFLRKHTGSAETARRVYRQLEQMELAPEVDFILVSPLPPSIEHSGRVPEDWKMTLGHAAP